MRANVFRLPMQHPGDLSELEGLIAQEALRADEIVAVIGKTEGNGGVNDFTRGYFTQSLMALLSRHLNEPAEFPDPAYPLHPVRRHRGRAHPALCRAVPGWSAACRARADIGFCHRDRDESRRFRLRRSAAPPMPGTWRMRSARRWRTLISPSLTTCISCR